MSPARASQYLLDTCTLIDLAGDPDRVAEPVKVLFARPSTGLFVSAASAWEVTIKTERGRLPNGTTLIDAWDRNLQAMQAERLEISHADALAAGSLSWAHRDPFDRMLVAQAIRSGCHLATRDHALLSSGMVQILDTRR